MLRPNSRGVLVGLFSLLFSFKGRINRVQYWLGSLGVGVAGLLAIGISVVMSFPGQSADKVAMAQAVLSLVGTIFVVMLVLGWSQLAIQVKRFHDRGQPGWLSMLPVIPMTAIFWTAFTGAIGGLSVPELTAKIEPWIMAMWAINLFFFVNLGCLGSQQGPNKYGDPPNGSSSPSSPFSSKPQAQASAAFLLGGAEKAMDAAIAEQARKAANAPARTASPVSPARYPAGPVAPAGGGFGRRAST